MASECLFCSIAAGEIPSARVAESARCLAFRDVSPQAPVHILVIPKAHVSSLDEVADDSLTAELLAMARDIARAEGLADRGYRVVINTGVEGGQTVFHLHLHVLGGRRMQWPPG